MEIIITEDSFYRLVDKYIKNFIGDVGVSNLEGNEFDVQKNYHGQNPKTIIKYRILSSDDENYPYILISDDLIESIKGIFGISTHKAAITIVEWFKDEYDVPVLNWDWTSSE